MEDSMLKFVKETRRIQSMNPWLYPDWEQEVEVVVGTGLGYYLHPDFQRYAVTHLPTGRKVQSADFLGFKCKKQVIFFMEELLKLQEQKQIDWNAADLSEQPAYQTLSTTIRSLEYRVRKVVPADEQPLPV
jgi:hypothetical protein